VLILKVEDFDRAIDTILGSGRTLYDVSHFR
jgi:hypothetical protein